MKKVVILIMANLFSGCYSYHGIPRSFDTLEAGERVKLYLNRKGRKGKVVHFRNDTLRMRAKNGKLEDYSSTEILKIKKGKFSWMKSIVAPTASLGLMVYAAITLAPLNLDFDWGEGEGQ